jgi:hypothetical protein
MDYMSAENITSAAECMDSSQPRPGAETDEHIGAVEGDHPSDCPQQGNPNAPGLDEQGLPNDPVAIAQDVIGANEDQTEG